MSIQKIIGNRFVKNALSLFSATLFAQIIAFASSPFLTRIYNPDEFGQYSFYISTCALLIVFTTGRYEYAINTVKSQKESQLLFKLVIITSLIFSLLLFIAELFYYGKISQWFNSKNANILMYFIPLTLLVMGVIQGLNYLLNRNKQFGVISKGKVLQSSITNGSSIIFGLSGLNSIGLVLSNLIGITLSLIYQFFKVKHSELINLYNIKYKQIYKVAIKNKEYPLLNSFSAFFDNLATQAPVFILMKFFTESIVGFYSLAVRVIGMPISLISTAITQVFFSEIADLNNEGKSINPLLLRVLKILCLIGIIPTILLVLLGPVVFEIIFGYDWRKAGEITSILAFGFFAKFVVSPLSVIFYIKKRVKLLSKIQVFRAITSVLVLFICAYYLDIYTLLIIFTSYEFVFYIVYLFFIFSISKK
ncbi:lipopolysaccharide biosynthesis protein [Siminovitchia sediminis]|uniref:Lipopolysaccharide biosynthesis protein n=1 Tax=Siminovitchia sediminis TaxID=1274353 RepID=A0ABW4KGZ6_9BACI